MLEAGGGAAIAGAAAGGAAVAGAAAPWPLLSEPGAGLPPPLPAQELDTFVRPGSSAVLGSASVATASAVLAQDPLMSYIYNSRVGGGWGGVGGWGDGEGEPCLLGVPICVSLLCLATHSIRLWPITACLLPAPYQHTSAPLWPHAVGVGCLPLLGPHGRQRRRRQLGAHPQQRRRHRHAPMGDWVWRAGHPAPHRRGQVRGQQPVPVVVYRNKRIKGGLHVAHGKEPTISKSTWHKPGPLPGCCARSLLPLHEPPPPFRSPPRSHPCAPTLSPSHPAHSFGRVYLANWRGVFVACKVLLMGGAGAADPQRALTLSSPVLSKLEEEAGLLASLRHPNIVSGGSRSGMVPCGEWRNVAVGMPHAHA